MRGGRHGAGRVRGGAGRGSGWRRPRLPPLAFVLPAGASALDVRDRMAVDAAVAAVVREFGWPDIVPESAGISHRLSFLDIEAET